MSNRQCAYRYFNDPCPLPGTMSDTGRPDAETTYYCHHHMEDRSNPKKSAFIYHEIMAGRLTGHKGSELKDILDKKMAELLESNPELFHVPTSPADAKDYQKMVMGYIKNISFNKVSLPYDKARNYAESDMDSESILTGRPLVDV